MHWNSSGDVDENCTVFRDTIHPSAMDSLGPASRKHQDCFDENDKEIQGLLEETPKYKLYPNDTSSVSSKTAYSNICKTFQTRLRDMHDSWLSKKLMKSSPLQTERMCFLMHLRQYMVPRAKDAPPLLCADETSLLTDKEAFLKGWTDPFDAVLHRPSSVNDEAINRLPQVECNPLRSQPFLKRWKHKTPVTWQGSRIRCNTCRDL